MAPASDAAVEKASEILAQVELHSFKATPGTVAPFAASELSWKVSGPDGGFSVLLENAQVPKVGEKLVTPLSSRAFRLRARSGPLTQPLGIVTVTVDQSSCRILPIPNREIELRVRAGVDQLIAEMAGTTRRGDDLVRVDQTGIDMRLSLKKVISSFPDVHMDIDAHWDYRVSNGQLSEHFTRLNASAGFAWYQSWVYLVPVLSPLAQANLRFAEDDARERVRAKAEEGAEELEDAVSFGFRMLSAGFNPANFEMFACPVAPLRLLLQPGAPSLHVAASP